MKQDWRLVDPADFAEVRKSGKCWTGPVAVVCAAKSKQDTTRIGFIVSKRVGKAVVRNRAKRLLREAFRLRYHQIANGWNIVVIARSAINGKAFWQVGAAVDSLLRRADLLVSERSERDGDDTENT